MPTIFTPARSAYAHPDQIIRNPDFAAQRTYLKQLADIYEALHNENMI
ncbi:hypothetical protein [Floridanema aerugineum]|jgi:hypothetical protein|uniref:Uncharacterized protein n=1 Tax=Floridaenema aerugineum BLCC-F46 TaxID=3153654 RepID=A0ABV4XHP9_9CYAN